MASRGEQTYPINTAGIGKAKKKGTAKTTAKSPTPASAAAIEEGVISDIAPVTSRPEPAKPPTDQFEHLIKDKEIAAAFANRHVFTSLMHQVSQLKSEFLNLVSIPGGQWVRRLGQQFEADVNNLHAALRFCIPYALCPYCGGAKCTQCKQTGWMPEDIYNAVPGDIRQQGGSDAA